jgi:hypothetical protein
LRFGPLDPAGEWAFYSLDWHGGSPEVPYLWSARGGAALLPEALGLPPGPDYEALVVLEVGAGGDAILLLDLSDYLERGYVWTRDAGLVQLEFEPRDMSADGRVVVGVVESGAGAIWDPTVGFRYTSGGPVAPKVSDSGEFVLMGTRWSDANGSVRIDRLGLAGGPELSFGDASGDVILAAYGRDSADGVVRDEASGLWRWTASRGAEPLGALPELPAEARYRVWRSVAEGRVVVGTAATDLSGTDSTTFRWSEERGMESIHEGEPGYVNADGTTIVGSTSAGALWRWTAAGGSVSVPSSVVALGGDLLVARVFDGVQSTSQPLKFDGAQGAALPIDIIEPGLLPGGDEVSAASAISENGRLLAGVRLDEQGVEQGWLVRLRDTCNP